MSPQFVDFDADGRIDILVATYDGSPHVALGSADGFLAPEHLLDPDGERVLLSKFWNYESEEWDESDAEPAGHCTSAVAFDWDADGDLDLLLGDYRSGRLFRRMNAGTKSEPSWPGPNVPVEVAGKPFVLAEGLATPRLVDWDGDGLMDLVCGGYGEPYGSDGGGAGIYWYRNTGRAGAPQFAAPQTLIAQSKKDVRAAVRPDTGLHVDAVDWDADGRLDLVVGGYSNWKPEKRKLSAEEQARVKELEALVREQQAKREALFDGLPQGEEQRAALDALVESSEFQTLNQALQRNQEELEGLTGADRREASVWLYRRTG
jgi:hypothetical protein